MDRFSWTEGVLFGDEQLVCQQNGVRLYDGEQKTSFDHGRALLSTFRLIWKDYRDQKCVMCFPLASVVSIEEQGSTMTKSAKIILHLRPTDAYRAPGPMQSSQYSYIKLSFKEGGQSEFHHHLSELLAKKPWEAKLSLSTPTTSLPAGKEFRMGIGGIQKSLQKKNIETNRNISHSFEDLDKLMDKAKEMVKLSKNISAKIREKQGDISEDETVKFKSYLLSLGISDPVTRETHGTGDRYYQELAKQLSDVLKGPIKDSGGMMTLTDVYCRINRARGMELMSPEDLVNAAKLMAQMRLPVRLHTFESGVMVLQLESHSEAAIIKETKQLVEDQGTVSAEQLSQTSGISVVLAKERLLTTEKAGGVCRDESTEGLTFYPNLFMVKPVC